MKVRQPKKKKNHLQELVPAMVVVWGCSAGTLCFLAKLTQKGDGMLLWGPGRSSFENTQGWDGRRKYSENPFCSDTQLWPFFFFIFSFFFFSFFFSFFFLFFFPWGGGNFGVLGNGVWGWTIGDLVLKGRGVGCVSLCYSRPMQEAAEDSQASSSLVPRSQRMRLDFGMEAESTPPSQGKAKKQAKMGNERLSRGKSSNNLGTVSDGASVAGSELAGRESDVQDEVTKHLNKLPLKAILGGAKLGLYRHHATEASKKLPPKHALQIRNHVRLAKYAETVQPGMLESLAAQELDEALTALSDADVEFPVSLLQALWAVQTKSKVNAVLSQVSKETLQQLLATLRPYERADHSSSNSTGSMEPLQIKNLRLSQLQLPVVQKATSFSETLMGDILLPMVMDGGCKSSKVIELCSLLQAELESDLMEELVDEYVHEIMEMQWWVRACQGLMAHEIKDQVAAVQDVEKLKQKIKSAGKGALDTLCSAMAEVPFWKELVASFHEKTRAWQKHSGSFYKCQGMLQALLQRQALHADVEMLGHYLRDVASLQEELPGSATEELAGLAERVFQHVWSMFANAMISKDLETKWHAVIDALLKDAGLCFVGADFLLAAENAFSEYVMASKGKAKLASMCAKLQEVVEAAKGGTEEWLSELQPLQAALLEAKGVKMTEEQKISAMESCDALLQAFWSRPSRCPVSIGNIWWRHAWHLSLG